MSADYIVIYHLQVDPSSPASMGEGCARLRHLQLFSATFLPTSLEDSNQARAYMASVQIWWQPASCFCAIFLDGARRKAEQQLSQSAAKLLPGLLGGRVA